MSVRNATNCSEVCRVAGLAYHPLAGLRVERRVQPACRAGSSRNPCPVRPALATAAAPDRCDRVPVYTPLRNEPFTAQKLTHPRHYHLPVGSLALLREENQGLTTIVPLLPTATKRVPFQASASRASAVTAGLTTVQVVPSSALCMIVPSATATKRPLP